MKIYLLDDKIITKYDLPVKIEEDFLITYKHNNETNTITIIANAGKWYLKSNGDVNILNNNLIIENKELEYYKCYYINFVKFSYTVIIYCLPFYEKMNAFSYNNDVIKIGKSPDCEIRYNNGYLLDIEGIIIKKDNIYFLQPAENSHIYINSQKNNKYTILEYGDSLFLFGFRIVWMKGFIIINNPNNLININSLSSLQLLRSNNIINNIDEINLDLYRPEEYFYHIPRLVNSFSSEEIIIDLPEEKKINEEIPFWLSIGSSLTMLGSSIFLIFNIYSAILEKRSMVVIIPEVIMLVCLLSGTIIMPRLLQNYKNKRDLAKEKKRNDKYKIYLSNKHKYILSKLEEEKAIFFENNPSINDCLSFIASSKGGFWNRKLWERDITENDFLRVRLGIGDTKSSIIIKDLEEKFVVEEDNLINNVRNIIEESKILKDVPITYSFVSHFRTSIIFNCTKKNDYINGLMTQILINHSPLDLKIVILTSNENAYIWNYLKTVPHIWNNNKEIRFFGSSNEEYLYISSYLDEEFNLRHKSSDSGNNVSKENSNSEEYYKNFSPYYLIITDDYQSVKNLSIIDHVLNLDSNIGFSFISLADSMKNVPSRCEWFLQIGENDSCIINKEFNSNTQKVFRNEIFNINMNDIAIKLANIPVSSFDSKSNLPKSLSFLEMYNASRIEQLNIQNRWEKNNPVISLSAPIGIHSNKEIFNLDLHEKYHGPHGLIAGTTGSGKSEFIITYILSMAINYHPYEVQFVLIDYKGGGLAFAFENKELGIKLPHLVGSITNLDKSEINRTLVSLDSEVKRRQRKFNEVRDQLGEGTIDIYKYQNLYREGLINEPMSHLFIISDEFAELKTQEPEFMDQLISISRIGRSLGVHLILATQKPSGVVNDQIWSNSKFKVCLKVQNKEDSNEMLKRPEAASLKEAGRFYLQIGYDDYFDIGQSGWSGAKYVPSDKKMLNYDTDICFVNNTGFVVKRINNIVKNASNQLGDQLTNIVKYICLISKKQNIITNNLWLDKIPFNINIDNLIKKYNYKSIPFFINPVIGEYDNPKYQSQGIVNMNLSDSGNYLIYGKSNSGKIELLNTLVYSLITSYSPEEVNIYMIDCGEETLSIFNDINHIGKIVNTTDVEGIKDIINFIIEQMEIRKKMFFNYAGSYLNYIKNSNQKIPLICVILNGFDNFIELYENYLEILYTIFRDSSKYGISFIISTSNSSSVRFKMQQSFDKTITLQLNDVLEYRELLNAPPGKIPANNLGRGLIKVNNDVLEFQTAFICDNARFTECIDRLRKYILDKYTIKAIAIKSIPKIVTINSLDINSINLSSIFIGYNVRNKEQFYYDFTKKNYNLIISSDIDEYKKEIFGIVNVIFKSNYVNCIIFDFIHYFDEIKEFNKINSSFDDSIPILKQYLETDNNLNKSNLYILCGFNEGNCQTDVFKDFINIFSNSLGYKNNYFLFIDNCDSISVFKYEEWFRKNFDVNSGIYLGDDVNDQNIINCNMLKYEEKNLNINNLCYVIEKKKVKFIKSIIMENDNEK